MPESKDLNFEDPTWNDKEEEKIPSIPKVYYGTRTHKQIEQVIRELRKTSYRNINMTILSSREHSCIQESQKSKTELCNDLLDPAKKKGCPFYNENNRKNLSSNAALRRFKIKRPWDIEDLVELGRDVNCCPYFAARDLMMGADIIFCPYNYIIDPYIKDSMQINLKGSVIILDEAHNIEDICRNVASNDFRQDDFEAIAAECEKISKMRMVDMDEYRTICHYLQSFIRFFKSTALQKIDEHRDEMSSAYWSGKEFLEILSINGIERNAHSTFRRAVELAIEHFSTTRDQLRAPLSKKPIVQQPIIAENTKRILETLSFSIGIITSDEHANDFKACIRQITDKTKYDNAWTSRGATISIYILQLHCMNSGVIFRPLSAMARSIILASGTLAPTSSFQSELGTSFPNVLSANHVILKDQLYVRCIPRGPTGISLKATYGNVNMWNFQDELGRIILDVCQTVPHGILCFFSSYTVMQTHIDRWKSNGFWQNMESVKYIFVEPRFNNDLVNIMSDYRECIKLTSDELESKKTGAIMFAVFRGKVAEGIDFKDDEARCVIAVGIPYAVRKDPSVDMKFIYNDLNTNKKGLLSGREWYTVQAYRALNQALGRCVRHINDWGAVLLVDERFQAQSAISYLPKWIKSMWTNNLKYDIREQLAEFVTKQKRRELRL